MANIQSAEKRIRQTRVRTARNYSRRSQMRTSIRKVEEIMATGDVEKSRVALRDAQSTIMKMAKKGILHKNTASRRVSRLTRCFKAIESPKS